MAQQDVIQEFRQDHRQVRDGLLELSAALEKGQVAQASEILGSLDKLVGPHFRYEEEALYPSLREFLGEYVDQLLSEHDDVIKTAKGCAELLSKESLTEEERKSTMKAARALLVHVTNCDGLGILTEKLSQSRLKELAQQLSAVRQAGVPLLEWAEKIRKKSAA